jgi:hypothetical protein
VEQTPVDIVLNGLKIGRRLHVSTRYPPGPQDSETGNAALGFVLSKIHASILSAILEPSEQRVIEFTGDQISRVREELWRSYDDGERHLALLAGLVARHLSGGAYTCSSIVSAEAGGRPFTLTQPVPLSALRDPHADGHSLATAQLADLRVDVSPPGAAAPELAEPRMTDHALEFEALRPNEWGVCRVVARSRPRDELWRHLADSLFGLPGAAAAAWPGAAAAAAHEVTLVVESEERAAALQARLGRGLAFADAELLAVGAPVGAATRRLEPAEQRPAARSAAVGWLGTAVSVRVRTVDEHRAAASPPAELRAARRARRRERWAARLAADAPLFGFSRALLRWIFEPPATPPNHAAAAAPPLGAPPSWERIQVRVVA